MQDFVQLIQSLDQTTKTNAKVQALKAYFDEANEMDKIWTIAILSHRRPKRSVTTTLLRNWAAEAAQLPLWLFEETYHIVGDLAETMAKVIPQQKSKNPYALSEWINWFISLKPLEEEEKKEKIIWAWQKLNAEERFVFNKLLTGGWRVGLSQKLMTRALSLHSGIPEDQLAHQLMGDWRAETITYKNLIESAELGGNSSKPYPFYLAYPVEADVDELGDIKEWQAEWKWDGIRGQIIKREGELFVWSRGEELVTDRFPEFQELIGGLEDGTVLDGEIIAYQDEAPLSFALLQKRIGRKTVGKKLLQEAPIKMIVYDILEFQGKDLRSQAQGQRRSILELLFQEKTYHSLRLSPIIEFSDWRELKEIRARSREEKAEGLMLKHKNSTYKVGRKKGDWWKWKLDPLTIDAVLIYAMRGHGRRANLYTDYTFAVWKGKELVPFTKAYSGLTDEEFKTVDKFVKQHTLERFGPVRSVKAELVFEIAFEGIAKSSRHKSGIALRFPRMHRWRKDKNAIEANTLEDLNLLLEKYG